MMLGTLWIALLFAACTATRSPSEDSNARNICLSACYSEYQAVIRECESFHSYGGKVRASDPVMIKCMTKGGFREGRDACPRRCGQ